MFFSFFLSALFLIILLISTVGYGRFIHHLIFNKSNISNYGECGLLGLVFISFISTFIHFFHEINYYVNLLIYFFGLGLAGYFYNEIKIFYKKNKNFLILFFLTSLLMLAYHKPNEDFGYYHLPYLINFISEKVIFGLSTVQTNQGWNSMWLNLTATYNLPIIEMNGFHLTNLVFFIFISFAFLDSLFNHNNSRSVCFIKNLINIFGVLFFLYLLIKFSRLNTFGFDVPSNFMSIYCFYLFLCYFDLEKNSSEKRKYIFEKIVIFSSFAVLIKLSNLLILLLPLFLFLIKEKKLLSKSFIFISCFLIIWSIQQFIYTGCFIFPIIQSCFDVSWFNKDSVITLLDHTKGINKSFAEYKGSLSELEYSQNFNWVSTWFNRTKIEILEHLLTFFFIFISIFLFSVPKKKNILYNKIEINNFYYVVIFIIFFQIVFWFNTSPVVRFGLHYVLLLLFFILIPILRRFFLRRTIKLKYIIILVYFGLSINLEKNFFRIFYDIKNNNSFFYAYPEIYYVKKFIFEKDITINYLVKTKSVYCWNTPSLCLAGNQNISINRVNGYLFVSAK